jgi:hypothetical protein
MRRPDDRAEQAERRTARQKAMARRTGRSSTLVADRPKRGELRKVNQMVADRPNAFPIPQYGGPPAQVTRSSMSKPSKVAEYLAEAERLRETVDAFRRARGSGADDVAFKPEHRRLPPSPQPTEIEGYPLNSTPPTEIPDHGTMARVTAIKWRQRKSGAQAPMKPVGRPELRKRSR